MTSFYSVIRYVPDPIADESINIGVVVFGEGKPKFLFVSDWSRAKVFGSQRIDFLKDFSSSVLQSQNIDMFGEMSTWDEGSLRKILGRWHNAIQFMAPKASLKNTDSLLVDVARLYLHSGNAKPKQVNVYDRNYAVGMTLKNVKNAVIRRFGNNKAAKDLIKKNSSLEGKYSKHDFDLVLANGSPYLAAYGLSFCVQDNAGLRKEVDALAFALDDVRNFNPDLKTGIVIVPPRESSVSFDRASKLFPQLGADFVEESNAMSWANEIVNRLPQDIVLPH